MATGKQITATLVVTFQDPAAAAEANASLQAEIDSRDDGLNGGKTSFLTTDTEGAGYLVFASPGVTYTQQSSSGAPSGAGNQTVEVVETVTFTKTTTANLSKVPIGGAVSWIHIGGDNVTPAVNGSLLTLGSPAFSVLQATYHAAADGYRIGAPSPISGVKDLAVVIFIEGSVS